jgi:hypothetical protein
MQLGGYGPTITNNPIWLLVITHPRSLLGNETTLSLGGYPQASLADAHH